MSCAPRSIKIKAYIASVLPILEYGSNSWCPTTAKQTKSLEMIHHNAARFVSNIHYKKVKYEHVSITKILNDLDWNSLEDGRNQARLVMAYKIVNNHVVNATFFFGTPKIWNDKVSSLQATAPSVDAFKQHFKRN